MISFLLKSRHTPAIFLFILIVLLLLGCRPEVVVKKIQDPNECIEGFRFYMPRPCLIIQIYKHEQNTSPSPQTWISIENQNNPNKDNKIEKFVDGYKIEIEIGILPDYNELYYIEYDGDIDRLDLDFTLINGVPVLNPFKSKNTELNSAVIIQEVLSRIIINKVDVNSYKNKAKIYINHSKNYSHAIELNIGRPNIFELIPGKDSTQFEIKSVPSP